MRRLSGSRSSTAVAVVAAVVAALAVMFPGLGFGQATSVQGGSPSAVYMQKNPDTCSEVIPDGVTVMEQEISERTRSSTAPGQKSGVRKVGPLYAR